MVTSKRTKFIFSPALGSELTTSLIVLFVILAFLGVFSKDSDFNMQMNNIVVKDNLKHPIVQGGGNTNEQSPPGMPMVTFSAVNIFKLIAQGVLLTFRKLTDTPCPTDGVYPLLIETSVIPLLMLSAGWLLLKAILGNSLALWPKSFIASMSGLLSMFMFATFVFILSKLPKAFSSYIAITFSIIILAVFWFKQKEMFHIRSKLKANMLSLSGRYIYRMDPNAGLNSLSRIDKCGLR